jgi:7-carboxy-7-deazaguanine synthase
MRVCEIFLSIQGEGLTMGVPTTFVRLSGCNLGCVWCDTKYARDEGEEMSPGAVLDRVRELGCRHVCVTGGEPLCQAETLRLLSMLLDSGHAVVLETNGSKSLEGVDCSETMTISMDVKCPASGEARSTDLTNIELLSPSDQLKFVIADRRDYNYARKILAEYPPACPVIMTPVGGTELKELVKWVVADKLEVRVLPQLHKLIWGEERGH